MATAPAAIAGTIRTAVEEVHEKVRELYLDLDVVWEKLWGESIHHGYYDPGVTAPYSAAADRAVEEALRFAGVSDEPEKRPKRILDVGCGFGGSSIYLAKRYGAHCDGVNISLAQIERARAYAAKEGLEDKVKFHLADAIEQPFPDGHFDLVWCMDAADHIHHKEKFFSELVRVTAPGGTIIITTICIREPDEKPFTPDENVLLKRVYDCLQLRSWFTLSGYIKMAESFSLKDIKTADWTENVIPTWSTEGFMQAALSLEGSAILIESGMATMKFILLGPSVVECYKKKLINHSIITCRKP